MKGKCANAPSLCGTAATIRRGRVSSLVRRSRTEDPAKFANGLIRRIIEHGLAVGYWKPGDVLGDPFGGVALGGIIAGYYGLSWHGVELEPRFVDLGNQNLELHRAKWAALGYNVDVRLIHGDSRQFASLVGAVGGVVTSPPYIDSCMGGSGEGPGMAGNAKQRERIYAGAATENAAKAKDAGYGASPGQIGRLPAGKLEAVVTSPPYAETAVAKNSTGVDLHKQYETYRSQGGGASFEAFERTQRLHSGDYGASPGNIGNLRSGKLDACVTSPPFMASDTRGCQESKVRLLEACKRDGRGHGDADPTRYVGNDYGQSAGQIGNSTGETYWQAMRQVYEQMYLAMKPGGVAAIVLKDYVCKKKRVPLVDDSLKLLVSLGFEPLERIHAMLVKESTENTLFEGEVTHTKERKSFFRRLAEKKGSPRIDWEEVLFVAKAGQRGLFDSVKEAVDGNRETPRT